MEARYFFQKSFKYLKNRYSKLFSKRSVLEVFENHDEYKDHRKVNSLDKFKFVIFVVFLICICTSQLVAQTNIAYYKFSSSTGNLYSAITGGTVLTSGAYDNSISTAITMGGTFNYGGVNFTTCYISSNGFVTFGAAPGGTNYTPMSTLGSTTGAIAAFGQDGAGSTATGASPEIRYQNTGTEFVVQFKDHANYYNRSTERLNFQIRLTYASSQIDIVYGSCTSPGTTSTTGTSVQVGMRGNSVTYSSNVNNLALKDVPVGTSCNWSSAVAGFSNTSSMLFSGSTNANITIPNGLKYTWVRQTTVAPVRTIAVPTAITSSGATISWTAPTGATKYDVQYRAIGTCSWTNWSGNPITGTSVVLSGLASGTTYQVRIKSSNASLETYYSHIPGTTVNSDGYSTTGTFTTTTPPATNDLVCNAVSITCGGTLSGTTVGTTNSGTGENQTCGTSQTMPGVWYVVAGNGQQMTASLCATAWDSKISVYSGSTCSSLTCVGGNDDAGSACSGTSASYSWTSIVGINYYILVHGYSTNSSFSLSLSCSAPPVTYISQWIGMNTGSSNWCAGETRNVSVTLKNNGTATWTDASPDINIGVKWNADTDYNVRVNAGNLSPGSTQTYVLSVTAPTTLGSNNLTFDVVYEGCFWFASNAVISGTCPAAGPGNAVFSSSNITINSTPSLSVSSNPASLCEGETSTLLVTTSQNFAYCSADATSTSFEKISNVTIGTINNNSSSSSGYEDFTAQSTNIIAGVSIPISVGVSSAYANDDRVHIWADINQNGVFDEPSERLSDLAVSTFCPSCLGTAATLTGNIIIPTTSFNGTTRLRVRLQDQSLGPNSTSCGSSSYGQVEDYTIIISGGTVNNNISYVWSPSGTLSSSTIPNPTASPINTTTYSVTATSSAGCTNSSTTMISVNPKPLINVSQSTLLLCPGGTTNVTVVASGGQSPYTGIGTFAVSEGNQSYTVTDANGCQAFSTINVQSNDNIPPSITAPASVTAAANPGSCSATSISLGSPSVNDNCTVVSVTNNAPIVFPVGTTTVIWTAQDNSGNTSTALQTVVVSSGSINYWTGNFNSDWFNSLNWCSGVPTISTDVQIPANVSNMPVIPGPSAVCRNITINTSAMLTINTNGILTVSGDFSNSGSYVSNSGKTIFQSNSSQQLTGYTSFWDFELNNLNGLTINSDVTILNSAILTSGILTTGSNVFQITNGGYLSTVSGYVNGFLRKYVDAGFGTSLYYEVGSTSAYTPLSINFNNVTSAGYLTVNSITNDHPAIQSSGFDATRTVNRYWNLAGNSGLSFDYYSVDLNYVNADMDPGFVQAYSGAKIYNSFSWAVLPPVYSANNNLMLDSVSVFGSLQIGVFNPRPYVYSLTPDYGYVGTTNNVTIKGNGFLSGATSLNTVNGITLNSTVVINDTTLTLNLTISSNASPGLRKFAVSNLSNAIGYGGVSDSLDFTVRLQPVADFYPNKTIVKCNQDENIEFYNYSTNGSTYYWDFGSGAIPSTATGFGPHTVSYSTTGLKTVSLIAFSPIGNDTLVRTNFINVSSTAPAAPVTIIGPSSICSYGTNNITYSVPSVSGVSSYNWTVPAGVNIVSGSGTNSIVVNFSSSFSSGIFSLTQSNSCGTSLGRTFTVSRAPSVPSAISGPTMICGISSATYSIAAVSGATSYIWTLPAGVTSSAGASPITTTSTSIAVSFASSYTTGSISVQASNSCGTGSARTLTVSRAPSVPGGISGSTMICGISSATYSITAVFGASSYIWTLPAGVTSSAGVSPITTSSTSIVVSFSSSYTTGSISVQASNSCGTGSPRTLTVSRTPSVPSVISGPTLVCGLTSATYSISAVMGASSYIWTLPAGVISSMGSSPITTTSTSIAVSFASSYTTGIISVQASNSCGTGSARTLTVSRTPMPGIISGPALVCGLTSATYSITAVFGASSYTWTLPAGVTSSAGVSPIITSSTSITVYFSSSYTTGNISVQSSNSCGISTTRTLTVSRAPSVPAAISGPAMICGMTSATYSITAVSGASSYIWTLPAGVTSSMGSSPITTTATTITVTFASTFSSGTISVKSNNSCSSSSVRSLAISRAPSTPGAISGPTSVCTLTNATYSVVAVVGATSYTWTLPVGITSSNGLNTLTTSSPSINVLINTTFVSGNITVKANGSCSSSGIRSLVLGSCSRSVETLQANSQENSISIIANIYPNPANDHFNLSYDSKFSSELIIEIYDLQGRKVFQKVEYITDGTNNFNYNVELNKGAYLINLVDILNNYHESKTLIIQ